MKTLIVILILLISFSIKAVELDIGDYPNVFGITIGEKFEKTCIESLDVQISFLKIQLKK